MFQVIQGGYNVSNAMNFQAASQSTMDYFRNKLDSFKSNLIDGGSSFMNNVVQRYDNLWHTDVAAQANALARKNEEFWNTDCIRPLNTLSRLQHCPDSMVRWMAAEPTVRKRMNNQMCNGWGDRYINLQGKDTGVDQLDYRLIYTGTEVEIDGEYYQRSFCDDVEDGDELTIEQRFDIIESHEFLVEELNKNDRDPTDEDNGRL